MNYVFFPHHSQSAREELQLTATSARLGLRILFAVILAFQGGVLFAQCDSDSGSGSGSGSSAVADLDAYSGAAAVYSVRQVYSTYAGSAVEVRRASDDQTQDIGFDADGAFNTDALSTFCSGTDCYVATWYDQSGNGKDASQSTASKQPQIYDSTDGVVLENDRPALLFDGGDHLESANVVSGTTARSFFSVHRFETGSNCALYSSNSTTASRYLWFFRPTTMGVYGNGGNSLVPYLSGTQYMASHFLPAPNSSSSSIFVVNNVDLNETNQSYSVNTGSSSAFIGAKENGTKAWKGTQQELIIYLSDESANREAIEENINDYFRVIPDFDEDVPFQNNPYLLNPVVTAPPTNNGNGNPTVNITTFESQLLEMIRALEDSLAANLGEDVVRGDYATYSESGGVISMLYEPLELRAAVMNLQLELNEMLTATVVNTDSVADIAQQYAKLMGSVTFNVRPLQDWGFVFDTDSTFATADTIDVPFTAAQVTEFATSESDTGSFYLEKSGLTRYTQYFVKAYAADCEEVTYADSVQSFYTLPDPPSGLTLDTSFVTSSSALLKLSIADAGGQGPDEVTFYYDTLDFTANTAVIDSLTSDSTGGTAHSVSLTGLTRYTDYYFNAFAENLADDVGADANMTFKTLPELPTFDTIIFVPHVNGDTLYGVIADDGGNITEVNLSLGTQANSLNPGLPFNSSNGIFVYPYTAGNNSIVATVSTEPGTTYYASAIATNEAGTVHSDTLSYSSTVDVTTRDAGSLSADGAALEATFVFGNAGPSAVGFQWGLQADLSDASDSVLTMAADSTVQFALTGLQGATTYYFTSYASNMAGTAFGDTLTFTTKTALTDSNIHDAANAWCADSTSAEVTYGHISDWNVSAVTHMASLFNQQSSFNSDISAWDVSAVTNMSTMFAWSYAFNQDIGNWDVSAVKDMGFMFWDARAFNQDIGNWDVSTLQNAHGMFKDATVFNQDIGAWDMGSVTYTSEMFREAPVFNQDIGGWDMSAVINMNGMFEDASAFNQDLNEWDVSAVTDARAMFTRANVFNQDLDGWDVSSVTDMTSMFYLAKAFNGNISSWDVSAVVSMRRMFWEAENFNRDISGWDVSAVTTMRDMFRDAKVFNQDVSNWDVSAVVSMSYMFSGASMFNQNLNWDVNSVTNMQSMFNSAEVFNGDISGWNVSAVSDYGFVEMFRGAKAFNQDIGNWDVSAATSMEMMFRGAEAFNQDIGNWDVSAVTSFSNMLRQCLVFDQDLSNWVTSAATDLSFVFAGCQAFNEPIGDWDVSSVTTINGILWNAFGFDHDLSSWDVSSVGSAEWALSGVTLSEANFDALLEKWSQQPLQSNVTFDAGYASYCYGAGARESIRDMYGWVIHSGGSGCDPSPSATTGAATNIGTTSADLAGSFENMSNVSEAGFKYSTDSTLAGVAYQSTGTTSPFTMSLSELTPNTVYYYRAYAMDELGTSQGDTTRSFRTHGLPQVSTLSDYTYTDTTVTLSALSEPTVMPAVTATGFKWGLESDLSDATDVSGNALADTFAYELTISSIPIYFSAYATNALGTTFGDTLAVLGLPIFNTSDASPVTDSTATLNASISFDGWGSVTATGFKWGYEPDLSDATDVAGNAQTGDFSADLMGLVALDSLYFAAYATHATGTSYGDTLSFMVKTPPCANQPTYTYEGYDYELVNIGGQCWFAENLRSTIYRNGDTIPSGLSDSEWASTSSGATTVYDEGGANEAVNLATYGRLYNGYTTTDSRGLCPTGWRVPTQQDFITMVFNIGYTQQPVPYFYYDTGDRMKSSPADTPGWNGTNSSGYSALPGGLRRHDDGSFDNNVGEEAFFWTSASKRYLLDSNPHLQLQSIDYSSSGCSVRCLREEPGEPLASSVAASSVTDATATLNGTVDFNGWSAITSTGFEWGYEPDLSDGTVVAGDTLAGDFSADLTGLVSGDSIYFSAFASNDLGTSYGDTLSFGTSTCVSVTFDDYDYDVVEIGNQCWFAENLRTAVYADGSAIPEETDETAWGALTSGARCDYNNEPDSAAIYGRLYNWYAVESTAGLCPTGWHVPTETEYTELITYLGGITQAGGALKSSPTDTPSWDGTNSSGWSGLNGAGRASSGGFPTSTDGFFWTSDNTGSSSSYPIRFIMLNNASTYVGLGFDNQRTGLSVRCIQDAD